MGIREFDIAGNRLVIHELEDVCHPVTGRALTGSWIWDSALVLSHWLSNQSQTKFDFTGKTVVELGAGAGLPGLTAARLGASRVILTDIEPLVPGLKTNVEANGLGDRVSVSQHVWGSDDFCSLLDELGEVDLVLISDVFFDAAEMEALAKTLKRLCGKGATVWAASELRSMTSDCLIELASEGFEIVELATQLGEDFSDNSTRVNSEVAHQWREGNQVTDYLARLEAKGLSGCFNTWIDLPRIARGLLCRDMMGVAYWRK
ncbi:N-lysine methyltransferase METTL21A-like [Olea europaea subsp. europaea]|uniref:N-lysine methyltransferase METTL21A-like n=1 Tax=Olea europaea subsp. europaea TaxID=158383 RepID=A0A8S0RWS1_OLEEU|nr:N-lysine methyltransferase METTL21A-like [Olea europaea subsp. europaea]